MRTQQMELQFNASIQSRPLGPRQKRLSRAHWWFNQMRQAVDRAFQVANESPPRSEQTPTALPRQETKFVTSDGPSLN